MRTRVYSVDAVACDILKSKPRTLWVLAAGKTVSLGWTKPELSPWVYIQPPGDGILDLDFTAESPSKASGGALTPIAGMVFLPVPDWVKGVRIHTASNKKEGMPGGPFSDIEMMGGDSVPWPWFVDVKK